MPPLDKGTLDVAVGVSMAVGLISCFLGYRLFKIFLALWGFLVVGAVAAGVAHNASQGNAVAVIGAGLVGGAIGAVLAVLLYFVGVFLMGAAAGAALAMAGFAAAQAQPNPLVVLGAAVVGGILAVVLQKLVIILATAFGGAWSVALGALHFLRPGRQLPDFEQLAHDPQGLARAMQELLGTDLYVALGAAAVLGLIGVVVQYSTAKKPAPAPAAAPAEEK